MKISEIKARLSIVEVLRHYGLEADGNNRLLCPFHRDTTPSLQIYPESNRFTCFSTNCRAGSGDVIDFVRLMEQCSAKEAIERAGAMAGVASSVVPVVAQKEGVPLSAEEQQLLLEQVWQVWRKAYSASSTAREYCTARGLGIALEAGYNSGTFHYSKPESFVQACVQAGLLSPHDRVQGAYRVFAKECVMFALRDRHGRVASFYGRSTRGSTRSSTRNAGGSSHFYVKNRSGLYPEYPESSVERLILCESVVDAASLLGTSFVIGSTTVLALYGTNGFTEEHRVAIESLPELREVVLWFDGDEAGRKAAEKWSGVLRSLRPELSLSEVAMAEGTDINGILVEQGALSLSDLYHSRRELQKEGARSLSFSQAKADEKDKGTEQLETSNANALEWRTSIAQYTVLGGVRPDVESMKVTLRIQNGSMVQRVKLDLYHDEQVEKVCRRVGEKLAVRSELLERDLMRLTDMLEAYRAEQQQKAQAEPQPVRVVGAERSEAMALLTHCDMFGRLHTLIGQSGVVGEEQNRVLAFVCCSSYRSGSPLHLISQGASGQGKTHLQEAIARLMPPEDVIQVTRMSEYSFYHFGEQQLSYKLFICEDLDGMGEEALLALREMQSKGWIAGVVTVKDEHGNFSTRHKVVRGPLATAGATTRGHLYEDNASRCFIIAVDESAEQTSRVVAYQNKLHAGKVDVQQQERVRRLVQNSIRLLEPSEVVNPYAEMLSLPEGIVKVRRTNAHYHELIKTITWLHQYQRQRDKRRRLLTEIEDIEYANRLIAGSLWQKIDDLDGSLRLMFERLKSYVQRVGGTEYKSYFFSGKEVRDCLRISRSHQHRCIQELEESEYIRRSGGNSYGGYRYRIEVWDDVQGEQKRVEAHLKEQIAALRKRFNGNGLRNN